MKNAIILHGTCSTEEYYAKEYPTLSNSHWFPWLSKELMIRDIHTVAPEIPHPYAIDYSVWKKEFERYDISPETILVGHSCGGGFLLRWLSENTIKVGKVILVAPWLDPYDTKNSDFFDFTFDPNIASKYESLDIFISADDSKSIHESLRIIKQNISDFTLHQFTNKGHFCFGDLETQEFPEILDVIVQ